MNRLNRLCIVFILMLALLLHGASGENSNNATPYRAYGDDFAIGSYVSFGTYPQTAYGDDATPIEWLVLNRNGNKALLLSRYGLDRQSYNESYESVSWGECTLRTWLNDDFISRAFNDDEQAAILASNILNNDELLYGDWETSGGNNTQDKLFLLSYAQANAYLGVTHEYKGNVRSCIAPTAYALLQGAVIDNEDNSSNNKTNGYWLLRSPGCYQDSASIVCNDGSLGAGYVDLGIYCIRPAMWVSIPVLNGDEANESTVSIPDRSNSQQQEVQTSADEPSAEEQPVAPIAGFTTPADGDTVPVGQKLLLEWTAVPNAKCYSIYVYTTSTIGIEWYTHMENGELTTEIPRSTLVESSYQIELKAWKDAVYGEEILSQAITINTYNKFDDNSNQATSNEAAANEATENNIHESGELSYRLLEDDTAAFVGFSGYGSLVIPETIDGYTVSAIADGACYWNSALFSVSIPDTVKTIGSNAFAWCISLESVRIGEGTTSIGDSAFSNNSMLYSIELPAGVTHIGEYTFSNCPELRHVQLPSQLVAMGEGVFSACEGLQEIAIPIGIRSIPDSVFFCCTGLESVQLPDGLIDIGDFAFYGCEAMGSVTIPSTVESIGEWAFSYCTSLSKLSISDATALGEGAFSECAL